MRKLLLGMLGSLVVLVLALVGFLATFDATRYKPQIEGALSSALGRKVEIGGLRFSLRRLALSADDIRINDSARYADQDFVSARQFAISVALWPLLSERELRVEQLALIEPSIQLRQSPDGAWNFADLGTASKAPETAQSAPDTGGTAVAALRVDHLRIENGQVVITLGDGRSRELSRLSLAVDDLRSNAAFPIGLRAETSGGAKLQIDAKLGPLSPGNRMHTPVQAELTLKHYDLASGEPGSGLAGDLDWNATLQADKGMLSLDGEAGIEGLRLFPDAATATIPIRFVHQIRYQLDQHTGSLQQGRLHLGEAGLDLTGAIDARRPSTRIDFSLLGKTLPAESMQAMLPVFGILLPESARLGGGTLDLRLRARGPLDALLIDGPIELKDSALVGFSLGEKMGAALALGGLRAPADTRIEYARTRLALAASGARLQDIDAELTDLGRVTGNGRIGADESLDFDLRIRPDDKLAAGGESSTYRALQAALGRSSKQGIGLHVGGTAAAPKYQVDTAAVAGAVLSGLLGGGAEGETTQQDAEPDLGEAVLKGLFKKKKKSESPEKSSDGGN